jgi:hypothetical protein
VKGTNHEPMKVLFKPPQARRRLYLHPLLKNRPLLFQCPREATELSRRLLARRKNSSNSNRVKKDSRIRDLAVHPRSQLLRNPHK